MVWAKRIAALGTATAAAMAMASPASPGAAEAAAPGAQQAAPGAQPTRAAATRRGSDFARAESGGHLVSRGAAHRVRLPTDIARPVRFAMGGDWVSWRLRGAAGRVRSAGNTALYANALPGVAVGFFSDRGSLKEGLILEEDNPRSAFRFDVKTSRGIRPVMRRDGAVAFVDRRRRGRLAFTAPYMFDSAQTPNVSPRIGVRLRQRAARRWTLTLSVDRAWLRSPDRRWPVVVDPTTVDLRPYNQCVTHPIGVYQCTLGVTGDRFTVCNPAAEPCTSRPLVEVCYMARYGGETCEERVPPVPTSVGTPSYVGVDFGSECLVPVFIFCLVPSPGAITVPLPSTTVPLPQVLPPALRVAVVGRPEDGQTLRTVVAGEAPVDARYQWHSCDSRGSGCVALTGETESTLSVRWHDIGRRLTAEVVTPAAVAARAEVTEVVRPVAPLPAGAPAIRGRANPGGVLTAIADGVFAGSPATGYAYQWLRCGTLNVAEDVSCTAISGATGATYGVTEFDRTFRLRVRVTAVNAAGSLSAVSTPSEIAGGVFAEPDLVGPTQLETPETATEQFNYAKAFRAAHGLRADDAYVSQLDADPALEASRETWGLSLTLLEQRNLQLRSVVAAATPAIDAYGTAAADTYAGYWIDQARGGVVIARFTRDGADHARRLKAAFGFPSWLRVEPATHTLAELHRLRDLVDADGPALKAEGMTVETLEVDRQLNRLRIGVSGLTTAQATTLRSRYGPAVDPVVADAIELLNARGDRQQLSGGIRIFSKHDTSSQDDCTSGFNGSIYNTYGSNRTRGMVTAGHCSKSYTTYRAGRPPIGGPTHHNKEVWVQHDRRIGETNESTMNSGHNKQDIRGRRSSDAVTIPLESPDDATNYIYTAPGKVRRVTDEATDDSDADSTVVISRGYGPEKRNNSGVVRKIDYRENSAGSPSVYNSRIVRHTKCVHGDSGSPVYQVRGRREAVAIGIVFARIGRTKECVYGHIRYVRDEVAFHVYTESNGLPGQE